VVIASGMTERRALPHLLRRLVENEGLELMEVRIPPRHRQLTNRLASQLVCAAWYDRAETERPDKFVVLIDADGKDVVRLLREFGDVTGSPTITASVRVAAAQWHLEAWFFADHHGLRKAVGRNLGRIERNADDIQNPKERLKSLLEQPYTAEWAERLARAVDPSVVESRSPSFASFVAAVRNGGNARVV